MILYGAPVKEKIKEILISRMQKLQKRACLPAGRPVLAIVQVGNREESNIYIKQKQKFGEEIGAKVILKKFEENISEQELTDEVNELNNDGSINGIIVQLPLPGHINSEKIINLISVKKDADGLRGDSSIIPATARAVMTLLEHYNIQTKGRKVAVIGQSILAGGPIANELEKRGAEVFRCDINTENIPEIAKKCDIVVSAVGKAGFITKGFINKGQVVIDVGINRIEGKLMGDVAFEEVKPLVYAITPVPGGVGPLTVACLFQNLLDLI